MWYFVSSLSLGVDDNMASIIDSTMMLMRGLFDEPKWRGVSKPTRVLDFFGWQPAEVGEVEDDSTSQVQRWIHPEVPEVYGLLKVSPEQISWQLFDGQTAGELLQRSLIRKKT